MGWQCVNCGGSDYFTGSDVCGRCEEEINRREEEQFAYEQYLKAEYETYCHEPEDEGVPPEPKLLPEDRVILRPFETVVPTAKLNVIDPIESGGR